MRSPRLIVVVFAVLLAGAQAAPAASTPQARIINGYEAAPGAWPAQTAVRLTTQIASYACGGTLVSARWVLTAGHCVDDEDGRVLPASAFNLRIGGTTRANGDLAPVDRVERHPSFRAVEGPQTGNALYFDVALLHLTARAVKEPIRMIGAGDSEAPLWQPGAEATVIGWGWTTPTGSPSTTLREAKVPVRADADCAAAWGDLYSAESLLCAGGSNVDTCPGDSGGPLMVPRPGGFAIVLLN